MVIIVYQPQIIFLADKLSFSAGDEMFFFFFLLCYQPVPDDCDMVVGKEAYGGIRFSHGCYDGVRADIQC